MPDDSRPVLIVAALGRELDAIRRRAAAETVFRSDGLWIGRGRLGSRQVVLAATGDGARRAGRGMSVLLQQCARPEVVLTVGVAGAISPDLAVGDLLLAASYGRPGAAAPARPSDWFERARALEDVTVGHVLSVDRVVGAAAERSQLWRDVEAGVGGQPTVVDLETEAYVSALTATAGGDIPYVVLRAVSDEASEDLPLDFNRSRDAEGRIRSGRVAVFALTRPWVLPALIRLRARVARCAVGLMAAVERLVSEAR